MSKRAEGMRTALVTGANKGIGFATARSLAEAGFKVWLGARSNERGRIAEARLRAAGLDVNLIQLDVTDRSSIIAAALKMGSVSASLDVLVNNAGVMNEVIGKDLQTIPPSAVSTEPLRAIYETNVLGVVAVTQIMLPLLRNSSAGRIVNVSSRLGSLARLTDPKWPPRSLNMIGYSSSKAALNAVTVTFAIELKDTPIKINSVTPGTIASDLSGAVNAEELAGKPGFAPPEEGARLIVRYPMSPSDAPSGGFFGPDGEAPW